MPPQILLNRHADPRATDAAGRTALSYCLQLDVLPSLTCAAMLLLMGAPPANCTDLRGEGLLHRAVRYGRCRNTGLVWGNMGLVSWLRGAAAQGGAMRWTDGYVCLLRVNLLHSVQGIVSSHVFYVECRGKGTSVPQPP